MRTGHAFIVCNGFVDLLVRCKSRKLGFILLWIIPFGRGGGQTVIDVPGDIDDVYTFYNELRILIRRRAEPVGDLVDADTCDNALHRDCDTDRSRYLLADIPDHLEVSETVCGQFGDGCEQFRLF